MLCVYFLVSVFFSFSKNLKSFSWNEPNVSDHLTQDVLSDMLLSSMTKYFLLNSHSCLPSVYFLKTYKSIFLYILTTIYIYITIAQNSSGQSRINENNKLELENRLEYLVIFFPFLSSCSLPSSILFSLLFSLLRNTQVVSIYRKNIYMCRLPVWKINI